jgi:hypothetical protein
MRYRIVIVAALTLILIGLFTVLALAQELSQNGDKVVWGNFALQTSEVNQGDLVVMGGDVTLPVSSEIKGDLVLLRGDAYIEGTVQGDIGMVGGNITLGDKAVVQGDIALAGGEASVAEGAAVIGRIQQLSQWDKPGHRDDGFGPGHHHSALPPLSNRAAGAGLVGPAELFALFEAVVWNGTVLLGMILISWLVAAFMPEQLKVVGDTLAGSTFLSFALGSLTGLVATAMTPIALVLLVTICLSLLPIVAYFLLTMAWLLGWIAVGQVVGERLLVAGGRAYPNFALSTITGVTVLTLLTLMPVLSWIPYLGFLFAVFGGLIGLLIGSAGLGAVLLTRFGTRPYTSSRSPFAPAGAYSV